MFDTYGPFVLERHEDDALEEMFSHIQADRSDLQYGIGVYIVAAPDKTGAMMPWYVGRTWNEFGSRIIQHYKAKRFVHLLEYGPINFFLLPRATPKGKIRTATESIRKDGLKSIRQLEFALIGTCLKLNPHLLNKQEAAFHDAMHVAGYIDAGPSDRTFPAAIALSKLLKT